MKLLFGLWLSRRSIAFGEDQWDPLPEAASQALLDLIENCPALESIFFQDTINPCFAAAVLLILTRPERAALKHLSIQVVEWSQSEIALLMGLRSLRSLEVHWPDQVFRNAARQTDGRWGTRLEVRVRPNRTQPTLIGMLISPIAR